jgi:hypothetical protein
MRRRWEKGDMPKEVGKGGGMCEGGGKRGRDVRRKGRGGGKRGMCEGGVKRGICEGGGKRGRDVRRKGRGGGKREGHGVRGVGKERCEVRGEEE